MCDPQVSVLLAARDPGEYLRECLTSLAAQQGVRFEVIFVDDGCVDGSIRACGDVIDRIPRITLLRHETSQGLSSSLNEAMHHARGRFVARMDADDRCPATRFQRQLAYLERYPDLDLVWTRMRVIDSGGRVVGCTGLNPLKCLPEYVALALWRHNFIHHPTVCARRSAIERAGGYRPEFGPAEDYDLWLRLSEVGRLALMPVILYDWRRHATSTMHKRLDAVRFWARTALECAAARRCGGNDAACFAQALSTWRVQQQSNKLG